ncbi:hypothetical protein HK098_005656 [Nowakowskiella sp. JEL0407]|nr:hypothetical protein HK098_005656 [Nowakowskiella sp. JEL0407]
MRQVQKKEQKNEVGRKKNKKLAVSDGGMELSKDKDVEMEENISYGNIDFGEADVKKKKGPTDIKSKLKMVEAKNAKLAAISALNPEKAASIADAQTWSTLIAKASGETVKDNPALLKKSIKREEKRKAKSTEKWKEHLEAVKKSQQDRARKREQNIMERSEKKKKGGLKRPRHKAGRQLLNNKPPPSSVLPAANLALLRSLRKIPTLQEKNLVKFGIEDGHLANMVRAIEKLKLGSGKYDVMLSYSWANKLNVVRISKALKARGFSVWIDVDKMTDNVFDAMHQAVTSSTVIIPCLSPGYVNSENCKRELSYAAELKKRIVPIRLQNASYRMQSLRRKWML